MANGQMPGLAGLAQGLRLAGGILSPSAREANLEEDKLQAQQAQQMKLAQIQQTVKGIEMGAIEPEAGRAVLKQLGFEAPVGPGPEAIARQEMVQRKREMAAAMKNLPPDASFEDRLTAMAPHLEPSQQIAAFNAVTSKREQLALRTQQMQMAHETRLASITNQQERASEIARHNQQMEQIGRMNASSNEAWKTLQAELKMRGEQERGQAATDRGVTAFANELQQQKVPALFSSISSANNLLKQYEGKTDIPGVGAVEGSKYIPNLLRTDEGKNLRSALVAVSNDLLNLYSGLAVTLPEAERRALEEMRSGDFTEVDFKNAWPRTVNRFNTVMGNLSAGASEKVLKEYRSRPGAIPLTPLSPAFGGGAAPASPVPARQPVAAVSGANETTQITRGGAPMPVGGKMPPRPTSEAEYEAIPAGTTYIAPDGKERRKR